MSQDSALIFGPPDRPLVGVLSRPGQPSDTAVLIIVGGPQYRIGSHRQFVSLARAIANAGHAVLRFDHGGMGDSAGEAQSFESLSADITLAMDRLFDELPGLRRVVLWGLCDGASAALLFWEERRDQRLGGMCLLNPWTRSAQSLARTHVRHYYLHRLRQPEFWRKLVSGGVALAALRGLLGNLRAARSSPTAGTGEARPFQERMAHAWRNSPVPLLLMLSGDDFTAKEFLETVDTSPAWSGALSRHGLTRHDLPDADHTFSDQAAKRAVEAHTVAWLNSLASPQTNRGTRT